MQLMKEVLDTPKDVATFVADYFVKCAKEAIEKSSSFHVALSGGSTPNAVYALLATDQYAKAIPWNLVHLYWSDERAVPPENQESNYKSAMAAGFSKLPIPSENIHRMVAEESIERNAVQYQKLIRTFVPNKAFDLILLGIGEDGHTASLFPQTLALHSEIEDVVANYIPQKDTWRMTFTYPLISKSKNILILAVGSAKAQMLQRISQNKDSLQDIPVIGILPYNPLWVLDKAAASLITS